MMLILLIVIYYIPFQFGRVYGDFHCQGNEFSTLKGFPNYIKYDFQFNNSNLYNLNFFPKSVIERNMDELFNDFEKLSSNDFYKNPIYSLMKRIDVNGKEMATF